MGERSRPRQKTHWIYTFEKHMSTMRNYSVAVIILAFHVQFGPFRQNCRRKLGTGVRLPVVAEFFGVGLCFCVVWVCVWCVFVLCFFVWCGFVWCGFVARRPGQRQWRVATSGDKWRRLEGA